MREANGHPVDRIIAKAWADEAFKARLIADPAATLLAEGVAVPTNVTLKVVENTDTVVHIVLPPKPTDELSAEALDGISGGACLDPGIKLFAPRQPYLFGIKP
ncbi:MAG: NHLP leader peptide family RiPP precursor [Alphaproteobacteria bacterium]|nr:NHLP leader peptide family RiPP precursor [Alphaproteobacteria bacterium]MBF0392898.1 NHLP leader peptide family RiPP precursor [Alphaproteobacteria bacterium]